MALNLDDYVVVSGMAGVHKIVTTRSNGLVVQEIDSGKSKFCSVRKHQFTPLSTVGIYTLTDTIELSIVFETMLNQYDKTPPVAVTAPKHEIEEYFEGLVPEYDEDKVYISDMKKVIKWFNFMKERDLLKPAEEVAESEATD